MGHVAAHCKGKKICAKCGGAHDYGENNVKVKYCNRGWRTQCSIRWMSVTEKGGGVMMVWKLVQKYCAHACVVSKNTLMMNKVDFKVFIGEVINTTRVVESRNARLKVIVETAKEILGVIDC